jgi:hypothetical protein
MSNNVEVRLSFKTIFDGIDSLVRGYKSRMGQIEAFNKRIENGSRTMNTLIAQTATLFGMSQLKTYVVEAEAAAMAQRQLTEALRKSGQLSQENINTLNAQAKAQEDLTKTSSEDVNFIQSRMLAFGASISQTERLTQATLDLAAGQKKGGKEAAEFVAQALVGESDALAQLGVNLDLTKNRADALADAIDARFGGQAAAGVGFKNIHQMEVDFGNFRKEVGKFIGESPLLGAFWNGLKAGSNTIRELVGWFAKFSPSSRAFAPVARDLGTAAAWAAALLVPLIAIKGIMAVLPALINPARIAFKALFNVDILQSLLGIQAISKDIGIVKTWREVAIFGDKIAIGFGLAGVALLGWELGKFIGQLKWIDNYTNQEWFALVIAQIWDSFDDGGRVDALLDDFAAAERKAAEEASKLKAGANGANDAMDRQARKAAEVAKQLAEYKAALERLRDAETAYSQLGESAGQRGNRLFKEIIDLNAAAKAVQIPYSSGDTGAIQEAQTKKLELEAAAQEKRNELDQILIDLRKEAYDIGIEAADAQLKTLSLQEQLVAKEQELTQLKETEANSSGRTALGLEEQNERRRRMLELDQQIKEIRDAIAQGDKTSIEQQIERLRIERQIAVASGDRVKVNQLLEQEHGLLIKLAEGYEAVAAAAKSDAEKQESLARAAALRNEAATLPGSSKLDNERQGTQDLNDPSKHYQSPMEGIKGGLNEMLSELGTQSDIINKSFKSIASDGLQAVKDGLYDCIVRGGKFGDIMLNLGQSILKKVISSIVDMGTQFLLQHTLMRTTMTTSHTLGEAQKAESTATSVTSGATVATANATGAGLTSIWSWGAAAAVGLAAVIAAMAIFQGFATGGIVGGGEQLIRVNEEGTESVLNARATRKLGPRFINGLNSGQLLLDSLSPDVAGSLTRPFESDQLGGSQAAPTSAGGGDSGQPISMAIVDSEAAVKRWAESAPGKRYIFSAIDQRIRSHGNG